ncbi:MAG: hypothetical protein EBU84_21570, partial [Actinobacteria bacterium]|nr:hypothetical protein [Actinomycetota bacterium]
MARAEKRPPRRSIAFAFELSHSAGFVRPLLHDMASALLELPSHRGEHEELDRERRGDTVWHEPFSLADKREARGDEPGSQGYARDNGKAGPALSAEPALGRA